MKSNVQAYLARKKKHLVPCVYHFYKNPPLLVKAKGAYLFDDTGKKYLDAYSGVGVVNCGHCHPAVVRAATKQLATLQHTTTIYLTEPLLDLAPKLSEFVGSGLTRSFFCVSGSEANEGAMRLAKLKTGRTQFIAHTEALHGRTFLTTAATGLSFWRTDPDLPENIHFVPSPICGACPYGLKRDNCKLKCADAVGQVLKKNSKKIAAMIAEPVHGNGGIHPAPKGYFKKVKQLLKKDGALLIFDEAQTGFGRTGKRFAFQHEGIAPDILTVCKALGNGLPISAFLSSEEVAASYTRPGASTFGGNPVSARAAEAVLSVIQRQNLPRNAANMGILLKNGLQALGRQSPWIREVRGLGLMLGVELVDPVTGEPAGQKLDFVLETMKDKGVLAGKTGKNRNVLSFMPPLVIGKKEVQKILNTVWQSFAAAGMLEKK